MRLTQRGIPLKCCNKIVYLDGVGHKLQQSQRDTLHPILLQKSQDVTRSQRATAARSKSATCVFATKLGVTCPLRLPQFKIYTI